MTLSVAARSAAKKAQIARLAAKGSPDYPAIYAKQPDQIRIAAEQGAARKVRRDEKKAQDAAALSAAEIGASDFGSIALKGEK